MKSAIVTVLCDGHLHPGKPHKLAHFVFGELDGLPFPRNWLYDIDHHVMYPESAAARQSRSRTATPVCKLCKQGLPALGQVRELIISRLTDRTILLKKGKGGIGRAEIKLSVLATMLSN